MSWPSFNSLLGIIFWLLLWLLLVLLVKLWIKLLLLRILIRGIFPTRNMLRLMESVPILLYHLIIHLTLLILNIHSKWRILFISIFFKFCILKMIELIDVLSTWLSGCHLLITIVFIMFLLFTLIFLILLHHEILILCFHHLFHSSLRSWLANFSFSSIVWWSIGKRWLKLYFTFIKLMILIFNSL